VKQGKKRGNEKIEARKGSMDDWITLLER